MASTIDNIDSYLKKNKKPLFAKLNEWYGKKDTDANLLKSKWNAAQEANGINNKLKAWNELQDELAHWTDNEELAAQEAELEEKGEDNWTDPQAKVELDKLRFFGQLSNVPQVNETDDLNVKEIYSQNYNPKQMKALAAQYGYDYDDKADRAEFLKKTGELIRDEDIKKIWDDDIYTSLVTPIAKEYAQKNWKTMDDSDLVGPLFADAGNTLLMGGVAGKFIKNPIVGMIADNTLAPAAKAVERYKINDVYGEDAAKDAVSEMATNFAAPWRLRALKNRNSRMLKNDALDQNLVKQPTTIGEAKKQAQKLVNEAANDAADIQSRLKSGAVVWDGDKPLFKFSKDGRKLTELTEGDLKFADKIPVDEYYKYVDNKKLMRGKQWGPESKTYAQEKTEIKNELTSDELKELGVDADYIMKELDAGKKRAVDNISIANSLPGQNKNFFEGVRPTDAAVAYNLNPKETKWNWAKRNTHDVQGNVESYLANLQGRTKWGGNAINSLATFIPGASEKIDLSVKEKPDVKNDPELQLLKRLYDLNKKNPNLFEKPKLPEKWKDYKLSDIFGE
jgi:hypothetical protein